MSNTIQLFQVLAWCQTGNKPLLEPIMNDDPSIDVAYMHHLASMKRLDNKGQFNPNSTTWDNAILLSIMQVQCIILSMHPANERRCNVVSH